MRPCSAKMSATSWRWIFQMTIEIGQHRQHAERTRRQRQRCGHQRRIARGIARDPVRGLRGIRRRLDARRGHVGDDALDDARRLARPASTAGDGKVHAGHRRECCGACGPRPARRADGTRLSAPATALSTGGTRARRRYNAASVRIRRTTNGIAGSMRIFGFAGWSGSGKTTLIEQVIPRLVARGLARLAGQARASRSNSTSRARIRTGTAMPDAARCWSPRARAGR